MCFVSAVLRRTECACYFEIDQVIAAPLARPSHKITAKRTTIGGRFWFYLAVFLFFLGGVAGGGAASLPV